MSKQRIIAVFLILGAIALGFFIKNSERDDSRFAFRLGLDLAGGTQLTYVADISSLDSSEISSSMDSLRDVIERRINVFGVSEPVIQVEDASLAEEGSSQRLIVELPGVSLIEEAVKLIGTTPVLEFKVQTDKNEPVVSTSTNEQTVFFENTGLSGRHLQTSSIYFDSISGEPVVTLKFNDEGAELFSKITKENIGKVLGIFLDGEPISLPVVNQEIEGGEAIITGSFNPEEARELSRNLRFGALPVPIELIGTQTVGAALGSKTLNAGIFAGMIGMLLVAIFMILWYRIPGLLSVFSLAIYIILMLTLFKLIPVTLTAAGIAGFILSIGMAVDANILIFERLKEERREGKPIHTAIDEGVRRAWLSIRDGNGSTLITAVILFYATTSLVKGFALVLFLGVLVSMITSILITKVFLHAAYKPAD